MPGRPAGHFITGPIRSDPRQPTDLSMHDVAINRLADDEPANGKPSARALTSMNRKIRRLLSQQMAVRIRFIVTASRLVTIR
jgi:hypothetical protein